VYKNSWVKQSHEMSTKAGDTFH